MQQVITVVDKIFQLFVLGLIGYAAGKTRYLPRESGKVLSSVVVKITAPLLIATKLFEMELKPGLFEIGAKIYVVSMAIYMLAFVMAIYVRKLLKMPFITEKMFIAQVMFGNVIYFGYPLLEALYGKEGIAYAVFFNLANDTLLWTLGVFLISSKESEKGKVNLKYMLNANTLAFFIGILSLVLRAGEKLNAMQEGFVKTTLTSFVSILSSLGSTTALFSMIFIGLMLSQMNLKGKNERYSKKHIFIMSMIKLIILPLITIVIIKLTGSLLPAIPAAVIILQFAMPCATLTPALASEFNSDYEFATEGVFYTTLGLIVTMPFIIYIMNLVFI